MSPVATAGHLADDGSGNREWDHFPAEIEGEAQGNDKRDRQVDVDKPADRKTSGGLTQITERDICKQGEGEQNKKPQG